MSLLCRPLHIPAAKPSGEARVDVFKEQVLLLSLDQDSETVSGVTIIGNPSGAEVAHCFDWEGTSIRQVIDVGCMKPVGSNVDATFT